MNKKLIQITSSVSRRTRPAIFFVLAGMLALSNAGCGKSGPATGKVVGTITVNGNPGTNLLVTFQPKSGGRSSLANTDSEGRYILNFNANTMGALVGEHTVSIAEIPSPNRIEVTVENGVAHVDPKSVAAAAAANKRILKKQPIPTKYNRQSTLTAKVERGENTFDFDLTF